MPESLEVGQRENDYHIVEMEELPNLLTVRPDTTWEKEGRQDAVVRADLLGVGCTDNPWRQRFL